jgi:hypothetical protein
VLLDLSTGCVAETGHRESVVWTGVRGLRAAVLLRSS